MSPMVVFVLIGQWWAVISKNGGKDREKVLADGKLWATRQLDDRAPPGVHTR